MALLTAIAEAVGAAVPDWTRAAPPPLRRDWLNDYLQVWARDRADKEEEARNLLDGLDKGSG